MDNANDADDEVILAPETPSPKESGRPSTTRSPSVDPPAGAGEGSSSSDSHSVLDALNALKERLEHVDPCPEDGAEHVEPGPQDGVTSQFDKKKALFDNIFHLCDSSDDDGNSMPPLVGDKMPLSSFAEEFESAIMKKNMKMIGERYELQAIRKVRRDANCFYRSFMFSYLEHILETQDAAKVERIRANIGHYKESLQSFRHPYHTFENCLKTFTELLEMVSAGENSISHEELLTKSRDRTLSNNVATFFRFVTMGEIQRRSDFFRPLIGELVGSPDLDQFCKQLVLEGGKDVQHVHMTALSDALGVSIGVVDVAVEGSCLESESVIVNCRNFIPSLKSDNSDAHGKAVQIMSGDSDPPGMMSGDSHYRGKAVEMLSGDSDSRGNAVGMISDPRGKAAEMMSDDSDSRGIKAVYMMSDDSDPRGKPVEISNSPDDSDPCGKAVDMMAGDSDPHDKAVEIVSDDSGSRGQTAEKISDSPDGSDPRGKAVGMMSGNSDTRGKAVEMIDDTEPPDEAVGVTPTVTLLYLWHHYDILYPKC